MSKDSRKLLKTIRFSVEEIEQIKRFIELNPYLDFSTVVRMAVNTFLKNEKIILNNEFKKEDQNGSKRIQ